MTDLRVHPVLNLEKEGREFCMEREIVRFVWAIRVVRGCGNAAGTH